MTAAGPILLKLDGSIENSLGFTASLPGGTRGALHGAVRRTPSLCVRRSALRRRIVLLALVRRTTLSQPRRGVFQQNRPKSGPFRTRRKYAAKQSFAPHESISVTGMTRLGVAHRTKFALKNVQLRRKVTVAIEPAGSLVGGSRFFRFKRIPGRQMAAAARRVRCNTEY